MLKSSTIPQNGSIVGHGPSCGFIDQNVDVENGSWNAAPDDCMREENISNDKVKESDGDEIVEITTAHWAVVEEEPEEPTNGFTERRENTGDGGTKVTEATLRIDPIPIKTEQNDLEWKIVPSTTVVSTVQHSRKIRKSLLHAYNLYIICKKIVSCCLTCVFWNHLGLEISDFKKP